MRRWIPGVLLFILLLGVSGCSKSAETAVVNTFERTPAELVEETEDIVLTTYYEMSDGTWKTDDHTYQYKLVITGSLNNAVKDTTYTILSNAEDITFEQAWKASGLSSNLDDYFQIEDAVFVAIK
ncbi:MAG: immunogenic protein [Oscillospiraceae bacterium]|nr:immunogenic protein [Oscillospiraceae bacterium]